MINELLDLHWQFTPHFLHILIHHGLIACRIKNKNIFSIQIFEKCLKLTECRWSRSKSMNKHYHMRLTNVQTLLLCNLHRLVESNFNWRVKYFQVAHINSFELVVYTLVMEEFLHIVLGNLVLCKRTMLRDLRTCQTVLMRRT